MEMTPVYQESFPYIGMGEVNYSQYKVPLPHHNHELDMLKVNRWQYGGKVIGL